MFRFSLLLTLFALASQGSLGQTLTVGSATPNDHASGVSLQTEVSFTFSAPLAQVPGNAPTLVALPNDEIEITETRVSADGLTLTYVVTLQPDTRYVFLILDATASDGDRLARPFALNLTTAASGGSLIVSGTVNDSGGESLDGTIVALVTGDIATGDIDFSSVSVLSGASGSYSLGPAPPGLYTVGAVRLTIGGGSSPEALAFGFYDRNGDGAPDPVLFPSGVDVTISAPDPTTAAEGVADASGTASGEVAEPLLLAMDAPSVDTIGRAGLWRYTFGDSGSGRRVDVLQVGPFSIPVSNPADAADAPVLPTPFVDSDRALAVAEAEGGAALRDRNAGNVISISMSTVVENAAMPAWAVQYVVQETEDGPEVERRTFNVPFSLTTSTEQDAQASGVRLHLASANPTSGSLVAAVTLDKSSPVTLRVLDARGRLVQTVFQETLPAGTSTFRAVMDTTLPSGLYILTLATPEATRIRSVILSR